MRCIQIKKSKRRIDTFTISVNNLIFVNNFIVFE